MKIISYITLLFTIGFFSHSLKAQESWTLEQCVKHAVENNLGIKQSVNSQYLARKDFNTSKIDFLPSINASTNTSYNWGKYFDQNIISFTTERTSSSDASINSNMDLFGGFSKINTLRQKKEAFNLSTYNYQKSVQDISMQIALLYIQILFDIEEVENATKQHVVSKLQLERTDKLVKAGSLTMGDLYNTQAQVASEELSVVIAQNKLEQDYLNLKQQLDLQMGVAFKIAKPNLDNIEMEPYPLNAEIIFNQVKDSMPEIKIAQANLQIARLNVKIAQSKISPTITGSGSVRSATTSSIDESFNNQIDNNKREYLGLTLNLPIFNKNQVQNAMGSARIEEKNQEIALSMAYNNLMKIIQRAYMEMLAANKKYAAVKNQLTAFLEAFKYAQQKFDVGLINSIEFADTKNKLSKAESDMLQAKFDFVYKTKVLDFYRGIPLKF